MEKTPKTVQVGDAVTWVDEFVKERPALVTAVFGQDLEDGEKRVVSCLNLVFVTQDEKRKDEYGRQMERVTSMAHATQTTSHCCHWK